jgi:hypothetical protein
MLEITRRSNKKKVRMRLGKYAKPNEGINWKPRKCTSDLAVNSKRRQTKKFKKIRKIYRPRAEENGLRSVRCIPDDLLDPY